MTEGTEVPSVPGSPKPAGAGTDRVSVGQAGVGLHQGIFGLGEPWEMAKRRAPRREKERAAGGCERQRQWGVPRFKRHFSCLTQGSLSPQLFCSGSGLCVPLAHHICLARARHGGQRELLLGNRGWERCCQVRGTPLESPVSTRENQQVHRTSTSTGTTSRDTRACQTEEGIDIGIHLWVWVLAVSTKSLSRVLALLSRVTTLQCHLLDTRKSK